MAIQYDVVVLGGGTGGYITALKAASYGLKTAIVEKNKLGGTCLHYGCIPTKSLLKSAEMFALTKELSTFGVDIPGVTINFKQMQMRKQEIVDSLYKGVQQLVQNGQVDLYEGVGTILGPSIFSPLAGTVSVVKEDEEPEMLLPTALIIATGAKARALPFLPFNGQTVLSSDDVLQFERLPSSILIVGGGPIGLECASFFADLQIKVTLIEAGEMILPYEDEEVRNELVTALKNKGVNFYFNCLVNEETLHDLTSYVEFHVDGKVLQAEKLLVAIGRQANIENLGLENTEIVVENGAIVVDESYRTKEKHIYAIGDCIGGLQLAHVANAEGLAAVEHIVHKRIAPIDPLKVPKCIYSSPQVASIGYSEQAAKEKFSAIAVKKLPFQVNGKAYANGSTTGFVKLIVEQQYGEIIGIHAVGKDVTELITQGAQLMTFNASVEELAATIHPHPSLSEIFVEIAHFMQER